MKTTVKQQELANLIEQVRQVALEISFPPPKRRVRNMLRVLAAMLDWRGIRPPRGRGSASWLTANEYKEISASKLRAFLRRYLPECLIADSPVFANPASQTEPVSKPVSNQRLANVVRKSEPRESCETGARINGWTVRQDKYGYFRAYRKVDGKTRSIYLGKSLDRAEEKIGPT